MKVGMDVLPVFFIPSMWHEFSVANITNFTSFKLYSSNSCVFLCTYILSNWFFSIFSEWKMKIILDMRTCFWLGRRKKYGKTYFPYILPSEYGSYTHRHGNIESNKTRDRLLSIKPFSPLAIIFKTFWDVPSLNFPQGLKKIVLTSRMKPTAYLMPGSHVESKRVESLVEK